MKEISSQSTVHSPQSTPLGTEAVPGDRLRWLILVLSIAGIGVATYLTYVHVANVRAFCGGFGDCESVNKGPYSVIAGIPVSVFGLGMYALLALLSILEPRWPIWQDYGPLAGFALALFGVLFSAYLTYLEVFVIEAICPWCVASAILISAIFVLASVRLYRVMRTDSGE